MPSSVLLPVAGRLPSSSALRFSSSNLYKFEEENLKALEEGKRPATGKRTLLGITKACLLYTSLGGGI